MSATVPRGPRDSTDVLETWWRRRRRPASNRAPNSTCLIATSGRIAHDGSHRIRSGEGIASRPATENQERLGQDRRGGPVRIQDTQPLADFWPIPELGPTTSGTPPTWLAPTKRSGFRFGWLLNTGRASRGGPRKKRERRHPASDHAARMSQSRRSSLPDPARERCSLHLTRPRAPAHTRCQIVRTESLRRFPRDIGQFLR